MDNEVAVSFFFYFIMWAHEIRNTTYISQHDWCGGSFKLKKQRCLEQLVQTRVFSAEIFLMLADW